MEIDIKALLEKAEFNPDDVVSAAAMNSVYFVDACEYRLQCMEHKASSKTAHERIRAEVELAIRKKYREAGEKITEGNIDALLALDLKVRKANDSLAQSETYDEYSKLIVEVFRMRRDCLRIVSDMTRDEIRAQGALEAGAERMREKRDELRKRFPGSE